MDEFQKTEARNYLIAGGLLLAGILCLTALLSGDKMFNAAAVSMPCAIGGGILIVIGVILLILQKRDLAGISFIILGASHFMTLFNTEETYPALSAVRAFALIWGIILLFSKDKQKWIFAALTIFLGVCFIIRPYCADIPALAVLHIVLFIISVVISLYFALAAGFERIHLPGRHLITADETTDFKQSGSALGYVLFAALALAWALTYVAGGFGVFSADGMHSIEGAIGILLIFIGILLFVIGKMRFTPVMFILTGTVTFIDSLSTGPVLYVFGAFFILLGLFAILRKESRILPGIMLIVYGGAFFISVAVSGIAEIPVLSIILNLIPALIALYLAVATLSQRKIPLL